MTCASKIAMMLIHAGHGQCYDGFFESSFTYWSSDQLGWNTAHDMYNPDAMGFDGVLRINIYCLFYVLPWSSEKHWYGVAPIWPEISWFLLQIYDA